MKITESYLKDKHKWLMYYEDITFLTDNNMFDLEHEAFVTKLIDLGYYYYANRFMLSMLNEKLQKEYLIYATRHCHYANDFINIKDMKKLAKYGLSLIREVEVE